MIKGRFQVYSSGALHFFLAVLMMTIMMSLAFPIRGVCWESLSTSSQSLPNDALVDLRGQLRELETSRAFYQSMLEQEKSGAVLLTSVRGTITAVDKNAFMKTLDAEVALGNITLEESTQKIRNFYNRSKLTAKRLKLDLKRIQKKIVVVKKQMGETNSTSVQAFSPVISSDQQPWTSLRYQDQTQKNHKLPEPGKRTAIRPLISAFYPEGMVEERTGHLIVSESDLVLPAGAVSLEVWRWLENDSSERGSLGTLWRLNWESHLSQEGNRLSIRENGGTTLFQKQSNGNIWENPSGDRVTMEANGMAVREKTDCTREIYDQQGRLTRWSDGNGNTISLKYNPSGVLSRVDGPHGQYLDFSSDKNDRIVQVRASNGSIVRYTHAGNRLGSVQVNGDPLRQYTYGEDGLLHRIDDAMMGPVEFVYDGEGRVLERHRPGGDVVRYAYGDEGNHLIRTGPEDGKTMTRWSVNKAKATVTDPLGNKSTIEYDAEGMPVKVTGPTGGITELAYDAKGRTAAVKDPMGRMTRFSYLDGTSFLKKVILPDGTHKKFLYDEKCNLLSVQLGNEILQAYTYNAGGQIASVRGAALQDLKLTYHKTGELQSITDALGNTTRFEYDARGNPIREINPLDGATRSRYDSENRLVEETGPLGYATRYEYDSRGLIGRITDPVGYDTKYSYNTTGRLASETDPMGRVTEYRYDGNSRVTEISAQGKTVDRFQYDKAGNLIAWIDSLGLVSHYRNDPLGRLIETRMPGGLEIRYEYDSDGELNRLSDNTGYQETLSRDDMGRITAVTGPLGGKSRYEYDLLGNTTRIIEPMGQITNFTYTGGYDLSGVKDASGNQVRYAYDVGKRLVGIVRAGGGKVRFTYDAMENVTSETDPLGNRLAWAYDRAGRLVKTTDATGDVTEFGYDGNDRLVEERLPHGKKVTYRYNPVGDLLEVKSKACSFRYRYNPNGWLVESEYLNIDRAVRYEYDHLGLRSKLIVPGIGEVRYEYGKMKQLQSITLPDGKKIGLSFDTKGRIVAIQYPNGVSGRWKYDTAGQITRILYTDKSGKLVAAWEYRYDLCGNLIEERDESGRLKQYQYDLSSQLIREEAPGHTIEYHYGPGGNRVRSEKGGAATVYAYDIADRMLRNGSDKLGYDANGRRVSREGSHGTTRYIYDSEDQLTEISGPKALKVQYGYSPTGERVWKEDAQGRFYYLYDGLDLIGEIEADGKVRTSYIYGPGLDRPLAMIRKGRVFYYHSDRLGSIRRLTDDQGRTVATYDYDAFGNFLTCNSAVENPFTYTGREFDSQTGLYYFRARYYDPTAGRFLTTDPVAGAMDQPLDQNPYIYVRNNPNRFVDPLGTSLEHVSDQWLREAIEENSRIIETLKEEISSFRKARPEGRTIARRYIRRIRSLQAEIKEYTKELKSTLRKPGAIKRSKQKTVKLKPKPKPKRPAGILPGKPGVASSSMKPGILKRTGKRIGKFLKGALKRAKRLLGPAVAIMIVANVATSENPAEAATEEVKIAVSSAAGAALGTAIFPGPGTIVGQIVGGVFVPMFWVPADPSEGSETVPIHPAEPIPSPPPPPPLPKQPSEPEPEPTVPTPPPPEPAPTPAPTPSPASDPSVYEGYGVYILKNVSGGSIWVGKGETLKKMAVGSFPGGGTCRSVEAGCPRVEPVRKKGPFATIAEANKAYCDNFKRKYSKPLVPGYKAEMTFGDYWIASAPSCN